MTRTIKYQHRAINSPVGDLVTFRALPTSTIDYIDPFLFLNHHGPQVYQPNNTGLPFGPHPHRGFETVTFVLDGDILHKDSGGHQSVIREGGVQWMTAGSGLIHSEVSSDDFKKKGGRLEILQLRVNLPARFKMAEPKYTDLQKEDIPVNRPGEGVAVQVVSGSFRNTTGAYQSLTNVHLNVISLKDGTTLDLLVSREQNIFFYVIRGSVIVNGDTVGALHLVEFMNDGEEIVIMASSDALVLFGHALPYDEPVVAQGPFVMNTEREIEQAYQDYRQGKLGVWND